MNSFNIRKRALSFLEKTPAEHIIAPEGIQNIIDDLILRAESYKHDNHRTCCIYDKFYNPNDNTYHLLFGTGSNGYEGNIIKSLGFIDDFLKYIQSIEVIKNVLLVDTYFDNLDDLYDYYIVIEFK